MNVREREELFLKLIKILLYFSFLVLFSCSGKPPEVLEIWWQLNLIHDSSSGKSVESLSLFVHAEDEDGEDDIDQIFLLNDDTNSVWNIPSDLWVTYSDKNVNWIGFNELRAHGDGHFSDGNYRILIVDLGGEKAESNIYLKNTIPDKEQIILPEINFDNENIIVQSEFPKFELWFYDADQTLIDKSKDLLMGKYEWNNVVRNINRRAASFSLYTEPENGAWGLVSGPYYFNQ